jgi:hypothetical protein
MNNKHKYAVIPCGEKKPDMEEMEFDIMEDFKLRYRFVDHRYTPTALVPPKYVNFIFTYSILGREETFIASNLKGVQTNCRIDEATNSVVVIFQNHGLGEGKLMVRQKFIVDDPDFPNGKASRIEDTYTGIILVDNSIDYGM